MSNAPGKISHAHARLIMDALVEATRPASAPDALAKAGARADARRNELLAAARQRRAERTT